MKKTACILLVASFFILGVSYDCFAQKAEDLYRMGWDYYKRGDLTNAMKYFRDTIMMDPNCGGAYYGIGLVYSRGGNYEAAVQHYNQALKNSANLIPSVVIHDRAKAYERMGKDLKAIDDYQEACYNYNYAESCKELRKKAEEWEIKGLLYHAEKKDYMQAKLCFNKAIKIDPKYPDPYYNRGLMNELLGNLDAAMNDYAKYLELEFDISGKDASVYDAYFHLGLINSKRAGKTGNMQYFSNAVKLFEMARSNLIKHHGPRKKVAEYNFHLASALCKIGGRDNKIRALQLLSDGCKLGDQACCDDMHDLADDLGVRR